MPQLRRLVGDGDIWAGVNNTGSDLPAKRLLKRHTAVDSVQLGAAATDAIVGVSMQIIKNGGHGDYQKSGKAIVTAGSGGVIIDSPVTSDGTGKGVIAASTNKVFGRAVTAAAADADFEMAIDATLLP